MWVGKGGSGHWQGAGDAPAWKACRPLAHPQLPPLGWQGCQPQQIACPPSFRWKVGPCCSSAPGAGGVVGDCFMGWTGSYPGATGCLSPVSVSTQGFARHLASRAKPAFSEDYFTKCSFALSGGGINMCRNRISFRGREASVLIEGSRIGSRGTFRARFQLAVSGAVLGERLTGVGGVAAAVAAADDDLACGSPLPSRRRCSRLVRGSFWKRSSSSTSAPR